MLISNVSNHKNTDTEKQQKLNDLDLKHIVTAV
jgi:hypothetical protein